VAETHDSGLGIPAEALGLQDSLERMPMRDFGAHRHRNGRTARPFELRPSIAVLSTAHDRRADWLRAGQALERVLLIATAHGVRASLLYQALEWSDLREQLTAPTDARPSHAQMVIRLGYGPEGPASPRRDEALLSAPPGTPLALLPPAPEADGPCNGQTSDL
jgi:hypothetical protein